MTISTSSGRSYSSYERRNGRKAGFRKAGKEMEG
jgi:hypothetical protein